MIAIAIKNMKRADKQVYKVLQQNERLTRLQLAIETDYSLASITRIVARLKREHHIRAQRIGKATYYEVIV